MSGARVSAPRLSSFIFFYQWPVFTPFRESNSHGVSREAKAPPTHGMSLIEVDIRMVVEWGAGAKEAEF